MLVNDPGIWPDEGALLGLDISKRRIGIAGTDPDRLLVTPLFTIVRKGWAADLVQISDLCDQRSVRGLVVGYPLNMDGSPGPAAQSRRDIAKKLEMDLNLKVCLQDERLTTKAVRDAQNEGIFPVLKAGAPIDHFAAALILEDALRALRLTTELRR